MIRALHWTLIAGLLLEVLYCWFQVMVVLSPDGAPTPMLWRARDLPFETLVARRLYAIEGWISAAALALYLGVTEVLPRRLAAADRDR